MGPSPGRRRTERRGAVASVGLRSGLDGDLDGLALGDDVEDRHHVVERDVRVIRSFTGTWPVEMYSSARLLWSGDEPLAPWTCSWR